MRVFRYLNKDERGVAMIMVIGTSLVMFVLATLIVARSLNDVSQARRQRVHEQAIHVADAGLERGLYNIDQNSAYDTGHATPPAFANVGAEKAWVLAQAAPTTSVCGATGPPDGGPACLMDGSEGQWLLIKPTGGSVVYAVGYVPTKAAAVRTRVIRGTFDTGNVATQFGILSGGSLTLGPNATIGGAGNVHANGNLTISGSGSIAGSATSTGSYSNSGVSVGAGSGGGNPPVTVPNISPRDNYSKSQYDLCPDGTVKTGPAFTGPQAPSTSATPCNGTTLATATTSSYRGWRRTTTAPDPSKGAIWTSTGRGYDGVYYVYQGSANLTGDLQHVHHTVFAEATPFSGTEPHCPHVGGDIELNYDPPGASGAHHIYPAPGGEPMLYVAGRDFVFVSNWHPAHQEGVIYAHEQFWIKDDQGTLKMRGSLIGADVCNTTGSPASTNIAESVNIIYNGFAIPPGTPRLINWSEL